MTVSVKARNISKKINNNYIIENLSFDIQRNSIVLIEGSNGSGKSVTLKMIAQLYKSSSGYLKVYGTISYAPDHFPDYLNLTIHEYLNFVVKVYPPALSIDELYNIVESFNLTPFLNQPINKCSKGTQQKVNIIQCLVKKADIYILDEPFSGLDQTSINYLVCYLIKLKKKATVILSSHEEYINKSIITDIFNIQTKEYRKSLKMKSSVKVILVNNNSNVDLSFITEDYKIKIEKLSTNDNEKLKIKVPLDNTNDILFKLIQKGVQIDTVRNEEKIK